jgi:hypothetical protein
VAVDHRHRIEQVGVLYGRHDILELGADLGLAGVVVEDRDTVTESTLDLGPDYRGDLLRRPRRASTTGPAYRLGRQVEDFDDDLSAALVHDVSSTRRRLWTAPIGHTRSRVRENHTPRGITPQYRSVSAEACATDGSRDPML